MLSDQLRRQALGCYGDANIATPHIDALAGEGVRFANACSTYPICVPFRFSLMTGEYAHSRLVPGIEYRMSPAERTLADEFNEAGYHTLYVGKWHLDGGHGRMGSALQVNRTPVARVNQGRWQKWFGFELRNAPFDTCYFEDDDPRPRKIEGYQTDGLFDLGMDYLRKGWDRKNPFCAVISVEPPHNPFEAPAHLEQAWAERPLQLPDNFAPADDEGRRRFIDDRRRYYAMVENLDWNMGRLRRFLNAEGLADNTVIVFVADHGELGGAHGLRGKQWPYEESVGIPLIVCDPAARQRGGAVIEGPTCTEDLFPTLLGLAGLKPGNTLPGADLSAAIRCGVEPQRPGVLLQFVGELRDKLVFYDQVWRGFRSQRFKYVVRGDKMASEPWLFFDLQEDPFEVNNLVGQGTARAQIARHHSLLRQRMAEVGDHFVLTAAHGEEGLNEWS